MATDFNFEAILKNLGFLPKEGKWYFIKNGVETEILAILADSGWIWSFFDHFCQDFLKNPFFIENFTKNVQKSLELAWIENRLNKKQ